MCIDGARQTVMEELCFTDCSAGKVHGLHHAAGGQDSQHRVEERIVVNDSFVEGIGQVATGFRKNFKTLEKNNNVYIL